MHLCQSLTGMMLQTFEKERSEGRWNWNLIFQAYQLALRETGKEGDEKILALMSKYYWEDLEQALTTVSKKTLFQRKQKRTTNRFRRIGKSHTYRPVKPKDPYPEEVKQVYNKTRRATFLELNKWLHHAYEIVYDYLKETKKDKENIDLVRTSLTPDTISVLSNQY